MSLLRNLTIASAVAMAAQAVMGQSASPPAAPASAVAKPAKSTTADCAKMHSHAAEKGGTAAPCPASPAASGAKPAHDHRKMHKQG